MASDDDFFIIRKFEKLGARVVLLLQNRISQLEDELHAEDVKCMQEGGDSGTFNLDRQRRRREIMEELVWRLEHYRKFCSKILRLSY